MYYLKNSFLAKRKDKFVKVTVPGDIMCSGLDITIEQYYEENREKSTNTKDVIWANGGNEFVFEDGNCIEYVVNTK